MPLTLPPFARNSSMRLRLKSLTSGGRFSLLMRPDGIGAKGFPGTAGA